MLSKMVPSVKDSGMPCIGFNACVGCTSALPPPHIGWDEWVALMKASPGRFKGLVKRAITIEFNVLQTRAALEITEQSIWRARCLPDMQGTASEEHGCLVCGIAFANYQAWGAHAARSHGYRARHFKCTMPGMRQQVQLPPEAHCPSS